MYIVDNPMLSNYYTLRYIASNLRQQLMHKSVIEAFSQERDRLVVVFEEAALIISCDRDVNTLWLRQGFARARSNSIDLFDLLPGKTLSDVSAHHADRVLMFSFDGGLRLDACFFGARSNVLLLNERGEILDAFKQRSDMIGGSLEYRTDPPALDFGRLETELRVAGERSLQSVLRSVFPWLGATLVREILFRSGFPSSALCSHVGDEHVRALSLSLQEVVAECETPVPRVYLHTSGSDAGKPEAFSIIGLKHVESLVSTIREVRFDDVHEAIARFVAAYHGYIHLHELRSRLVEKLKTRIARLQRTIAVIQSELDAASRADEYGRYGTLIMSNLHLVKQGDRSVALDDAGVSVVVPLEQHLTPVQNAQRYFEKAKQARARRRIAEQRVAELRDELKLFEGMTLQLGTIHTYQELKTFMSQHERDLETLGLNARGEEQEPPPFRVFVVDGGFEVWAGRNSTNNDELTFKHAKANDLWFHARGASGSHVILKVNSAKGEPSKKAKEQAAAIAAYYSKMRNAKTVPVAMTERKFVRKPKGAPAGTVLVEREKVIFVEPALPHEER